MKKAFFYLALLIMLALFFEGASFLFFNKFGERFTCLRPVSPCLIAESDIPKVKHNFNHNLGWKTPANSPYGERPRAVDYPLTFMATFGDSFTYCDQVHDSETWEEYLSLMIGRSAYNFGNPGYGTDQALLRFREDYPKVKTKMVSLGLITENINRVVNSLLSLQLLPKNLTQAVSILL